MLKGHIMKGVWVILSLRGRVVSEQGAPNKHGT